PDQHCAGTLITRSATTILNVQFIGRRGTNYFPRSNLHQKIPASPRAPSIRADRLPLPVPHKQVRTVFSERKVQTVNWRPTTKRSLFPLRAERNSKWPHSIAQHDK